MTARLWVDASVARKPGTLWELTELAMQRAVEVRVHAHVHLELCRAYRVNKGAEFSQGVIDSYLTQRRVVVDDMRLDKASAERWAERLYRRFPSHEEWEAGKLATLGGELRAEFVREPGRMPMTTDWWVAMLVEDGDDDRIAVDDEGGEWTPLRDMKRALRSSEAVDWLHSLT